MTYDFESMSLEQLEIVSADLTQQRYALQRKHKALAAVRRRKQALAQLAARSKGVGIDFDKLDANDVADLQRIMAKSKPDAEVVARPALIEVTTKAVSP